MTRLSEAVRAERHSTRWHGDDERIDPRPLRETDEHQAHARSERNAPDEMKEDAPEVGAPDGVRLDREQHHGCSQRGVGQPTGGRALSGPVGTRLSGDIITPKTTNA